MIMKRFLVISLLAVAVLPARACFSEGPTHHYYMFDVLPRDSYAQRTDSLLQAYWQKTLGEDHARDVFYSYTREWVMKKVKGDKELTAYLTHLYRYTEVCEQLHELWSYPTKAQLAQRRQWLNAMIAAQKNYRGKRFQAQYALLRMRAHLLLGQDAQNMTFYQQTGIRHKGSVYGEMMRNIYARALLKAGRMTESANIYAEQGDWTSIAWAVRKYRNLAGIKKIYASNPNALCLQYLVQDFVNNVQESIDTDDKDYIETVGRRQILRQEARDFIAFASQVQSRTPALWLTAIGMLQYDLGQSRQAVATLDKALAAQGTPEMKRCARAIRLLSEAHHAPLTPAFSAYAQRELQQMGYCHATERIVWHELIPKYRQAGRPEVAAAMLSMMNEMEKRALRSKRHAEASEDDFSYNADYASYNEFYCCLDTMSTDALRSTAAYVQSSPTDVLEKWVVEQSYRDADFWNDLIGTRLIAQGKWDEAIPLLEKVPLTFISRQNISWYMTHRDYTRPRWFFHERVSWERMYETEGPGKGVAKHNLKLQFCRDVINLEAQHRLAREEQRPQLAYDLAVRLVQASHAGDCWFLTHYGHSIADTVATGEKDYLRQAATLLAEAAKSTDKELRLQSLYALAWLPIDNWYYCQWGTDADAYINDTPDRYPSAMDRDELRFRPTGHQYLALKALRDYARPRWAQMPAYITRCDVLKEFEQSLTSH